MGELQPQYGGSPQPPEEKGWFEEHWGWLVAAVVGIFTLGLANSNDEVTWDEKKGFKDNIKKLWGQEKEGLVNTKNDIKTFFTGEPTVPKKTKKEKDDEANAQLNLSGINAPAFIGSSLIGGKMIIDAVKHIITPTALDGTSPAKQFLESTKDNLGKAVETAKDLSQKPIAGLGWLDKAKNLWGVKHIANAIPEVTVWAKPIAPVLKGVGVVGGSMVTYSNLSHASDLGDEADALDDVADKEAEAKLKHRAARLEGITGAVEGFGLMAVSKSPANPLAILAALGGTIVKDAAFIFDRTHGGQDVTRTAAADFVGKTLHGDDAAEYIMEHGLGKAIDVVTGNDFSSIPAPPAKPKSK